MKVDDKQEFEKYGVDAKQGIKEKQGLSEALARYAEDTTFHGLRYTTKTKGLSRLLLILLILLAASGFFYQLTNRAMYFLTDPTNINIIINEEPKVALPAIAICRPGIYRGYFRQSQDTGYDVNFHTAAIVSYQKEDILRSATFKEHDIWNKTYLLYTEFGACVGYNIDVDDVAMVDKSGFNNGLTFYLDGIKENVAKDGYVMVVYQQGDYPRVWDNSVPILTGKSTKVSIKKKELELLDDAGKCGEKSLKYFKTYSKKACEAECELEIVENLCECIPYEYAALAELSKYKRFCAVNGDCPFSANPNADLKPTKCTSKDIHFLIDSVKNGKHWNETVKLCQMMLKDFDVPKLTEVTYGQLDTSKFTHGRTHDSLQDLVIIINPDLKWLNNTKDNLDNNVISILTKEHIEKSWLNIEYCQIVDDLLMKRLKWLCVFGVDNELIKSYINNIQCKLRNQKTIDVNRKYEGIPDIDCRTKRNGIKYEGKTSETLNHFQCEFWNNTDIFQFFNEIEPKDNYCGRVNGAVKPWCYLANSADIRYHKANWDYCDIPICYQDDTKEKISRCKRVDVCPPSCKQTQYTLTSSVEEINDYQIKQFMKAAPDYRTEIAELRNANSMKRKSDVRVFRMVGESMRKLIKLIEFIQGPEVDVGYFNQQLEMIIELEREIQKNSNNNAPDKTHFLQYNSRAMKLLKIVRDFNGWIGNLRSIAHKIDFLGDDMEFQNTNRFQWIDFLVSFEWYRKSALMMSYLTDIHETLINFVEAVVNLSDTFCGEFHYMSANLRSELGSSLESPHSEEPGQTCYSDTVDYNGKKIVDSEGRSCVQACHKSTRTYHPPNTYRCRHRHISSFCSIPKCAKEDVPDLLFSWIVTSRILTRAYRSEMNNPDYLCKKLGYDFGRSLKINNTDYRSLKNNCNNYSIPESFDSETKNETWVTCGGGRGLCGVISRIKATNAIVNDTTKLTSLAISDMKILNKLARKVEYEINDSTSFVKERIVALTLNYESLNFETYIFQHAYSGFSLLCDIGGTAGLFLGASILTIIETVYYFSLLGTDSDSCYINAEDRNLKRRKKTAIIMIIIFLGMVIAGSTLVTYFVFLKQAQIITQPNNNPIQGVGNVEKEYKKPNCSNFRHIRLNFTLPMKNLYKHHSWCWLTLDGRDNIYSTLTIDGEYYLSIIFANGGISLHKLRHPSYEPYGILVTKTNVYVGYQLGWVVAYNIPGKYLFEFIINGSVTDLTLNPDGNLMILDSYHERILFYTQDGRYIKSFGEKGDKLGQFRYLKGILWHKATNQWIVSESFNHRLQILNFTIGSLGSGDENFIEPTKLAEDAYGNIYVADRKNHRIQVLGPQMDFICHFGSEVLFEPYGIAITRAGSVVVSDFYSIYVFSEDHENIWPPYQRHA